MVAAHALTRRHERHALPAPQPRAPEPDWEIETQSGQVELEPLIPSGNAENGDLPALPRRRSRRGHAVPEPQPKVDWPAERDVEEDPEEAGQWMNAFLSGAAVANGEDRDQDGDETYPTTTENTTSEDNR
jgi:hypothetical protein